MTTSKELVLKAYEVLAARDFDGLGRLLSEDFTSHNPGLPDGRTAVVEFLRGSPIADAKVDVQQVIAEENLVAVHHRSLLPGEQRSRAVVDIWRVDSGLIAEHWDVIQP